MRLHGLTISEVHKIDLRQGKLSQLMITSVANGSQAWLFGFRAGDELTAVNRQKIESLDALSRLFRQAEDGFLIQVKRGAQGLHVLLN